MEKCRKKWKTMKMGQILMEKGQNWWKGNKITFCGLLSEKYGKMSQKVKNDENGSDIHEKGQNW